MLIGGLGFLVSMAVYYPLTLFFKDYVVWLGQQFYLPATIPSTLASVTFNYYMNRKFTFGDCPAKRLSLLRYQVMGMTTALLDIFMLFLLVHFLSIFYLLAAVIAVISMFLVRYFIANKWIWKTGGRRELAEKVLG